MRTNTNPARVLQLNGDETVISCEDGRVARASNASGSLDFLYENGRLVCARDSAGREVRYAYDENRRLNRITNPDGDSMSCGYDESGLLSTMTDFCGVEFLKNTYREGRVAEQYVAGQGTANCWYTTARAT
jgi:YD repeat-containing protein